MFICLFESLPCGQRLCSNFEIENLRKCFIWFEIESRAWFGKFIHVVKKFGLKINKSNYYVFYKRFEPDIILFVVYVDGIAITGSDSKGIISFK